MLAFDTALVKPGNIFVDSYNLLYLGDYGLLSRDYRPDETSEKMAITGTIAYLSPERLQDLSPEVLIAEVDNYITEKSKLYQSVTCAVIAPKVFGQKGDIWAVGVILLEIMAGRHPFDKTSLSTEELITKIINAEINVREMVKDRGYSMELVIFVEKCLQVGIDETGEPTRWGYAEIEKSEVFSNKVDELVGNSHLKNKELDKVINELTKGINKIL